LSPAVLSCPTNQIASYSICSDLSARNLSLKCSAVGFDGRVIEEVLHVGSIAWIAWLTRTSRPTVPPRRVLEFRRWRIWEWLRYSGRRKTGKMVNGGVTMVHARQKQPSMGTPHIHAWRCSLTPHPHRASCITRPPATYLARIPSGRP
jgi:hypothetical protein